MRKQIRSSNYIDTFVVRLISGEDTVFINILFYNNNILGANDTKKLIDTTYQTILLSKSDCYKISGVDSSLYAIPPQIVEGEKSDTLIFELLPSKICEDISFSLRDTCAVCGDEPTTFVFYNKALTADKYATCYNNTKLDVKNCKKALPDIINCTYYRCDSLGVPLLLVDRIDTIIVDNTTIQYDTIFTYDTLENDIVDTVGNYKIICTDAHGNPLDTFDFTVNKDDLKLPFEVQYLDIYNMSKELSPSERCEYTISLYIAIPLADEGKLNSYSFDAVASSGVVLNSISDSTFIENPNLSKPKRVIIKKFKFILDCDSNDNFNNIVTFHINNISGGYNLEVCSHTIPLFSCCNFACSNCMHLSLEDTNYAPIINPGQVPIYDDRYKRYVTVTSVCPGKKIKNIEQLLLGTTDVISYNYHNIYPSKDEWLISLTPPCTGKNELAVYSICATFDDFTVCCDTISFSYKCNRYFRDDCCYTTANPDVTGNIVIEVPLKVIPDFPLYVSINDMKGNEVLSVSAAIPVDLVPEFNVNVGKLSAGIYYIVCRIEDEQITMPFVRQ